MRLFVLGAGASIDHTRGRLPGAEGLFARALEEVATSGSVQQQSALEVAVKRFYGFDPFEVGEEQKLRSINIEDLLTLCSLEQEVDPYFPNIAIFTDIIVNTISACQAGLDESSSTYGRFSAGLQPHDSVLTFNWDTLLDPFVPGYKPCGEDAGDGMYRNYQRYCTAEWERTFAGTGFQAPYATIREYVGRDDRGGEERAFIKLHGSIDLTYCSNNGCRQYGRPIRTPAPKKRVFCGDCHEVLVPYIVPPTQAKPIRQAAYIRRAWSVGSKLLQAADEVIFWGYSLPPTDYWASWLIRHAWFGECRRIAVINPEAFFKQQPERVRLDFVRRFAPVRFAKGRQEVVVCPGYDDYTRGELHYVSELAD